jgi:hypothetical protein
MTTIQSIMADPRYHQFAAAVTECGKQVVPDAFPWNRMGQTDDQILAVRLAFADGRPMPREHVLDLIAVVRAQEKLVQEYWEWWLGWMWIGKRAVAETVMMRGNPAAAAEGMLF